MKESEPDYGSQLAAMLLKVLLTPVDGGGRTIASCLPPDLRASAMGLLKLATSSAISTARDDYSNIDLSTDPDAQDLIKCGSWLFKGVVIPGAPDDKP